MKLLPLLVAALASVLLLQPAGAVTYRVTIDTTPLQGVAGFAAFDFLAGAPLTGNSATVSGFGSDGSLGAATSSGNVSGQLLPGPLTLGGGAQFFNEWLQTYSAFGSTMTYELDLGEIVQASGRADEFAFFLLDVNQLPIVTTDPTGAGALFYFDLAGAATSPVIFTSASAAATIVPIIASVPEPDTFPLVLAGMAVVVALGARIERRLPRLGL